MSSSTLAASIIYLGLDVHKDTVTIAVLPADAKAPTRIDQYPNDFAKLRRVFERHAKDGEIRACYEASGAGCLRHPRPARRTESLPRQPQRAAPMVARASTRGTQWAAPHQTTNACGSQSDRSMKVLVLAVALAAGSISAASATAQLSPTLLPVVTRLRSGDIKPEEGFSGVVGAAFLPTGGIVVGDAGRRAILRFSPDGRYLGSFGRQGKGPGEFEDLIWLGSCADGSVIALDAANRISIFDRAGRFVKAFVPPTWFIYDKVLSCADAERVIILQDMPRTIPRLRERTTTFPAFVASAKWVASIDTLAALSGTEYYFAKALGFIDLPLGDRAIAAAAGGLIAAGVSGSGKVLFLREDGGRIDTLQVAGPRARVTDSDWQRAKTERLATEFNEEARRTVQALLREAKAPTLLPVFDALMVDRFNSGVWARLYTRTDRAEWHRLNPAPRGRARFLLPTDVQVLSISSTQLLGLRRQADGTEELILYAFQR